MAEVRAVRATIAREDGDDWAEIKAALTKKLTNATWRPFDIPYIVHTFHSCPTFDERRFVLLGASTARRVLAVIHCEQEAGGVVRLISARKADRDERAIYIARRTP